MKNEERINRFTLPGIKPEIILTHGYTIKNNFLVHFHKSFSLGVIESGKRELFIRGTKYLIKKRDVFIIQPFEPHSIFNSGKEEHTYKIISFGFSEVSSSYFPELVIRDKSLFEFLEVFHDTAEYNFSIETAARQLKEIKARLTEFVLPLPENKSHVSESIIKAKEFIERNCSIDIAVEDISSEVCLSVYHFTRLFHNETGMSPYAYLIYCRVKESQNKLKSGSSKASIAFDTGFFDQSHFIKTFKKHVGVSPKNFFNK